MLPNGRWDLIRRLKGWDAVCTPLALVLHCAVYCGQRGLPVLVSEPNGVQIAATRLLTVRALASYLLSWGRREKFVERKLEGLDWRERKKHVFSGVKHVTCMRNFPLCRIFFRTNFNAHFNMNMYVTLSSTCFGPWDAHLQEEKLYKHSIWYPRSTRRLHTIPVESGLLILVNWFCLFGIN